MVEHVRDGSGTAELGTRLVETGAHLGERSVVVVGETVDDDHDVRRAEALVARGAVVLAGAASGFVDRLVDHVPGHLFLLGALHQTPQAQVGVEVSAAVLGADVDLLAVAGIQSRLV